jgi:NAD(P)-dependent dehydrogenase (short-subunit alcohol dehydrogenase family)
VHLTKTLADQLGGHGITVNLVHPGTTRTERTGEETERRAASNAIPVMFQCSTGHSRR